MKETLERFRPRLDDAQRRTILDRLRSERQQSGGAEEAGLRRWSFSFGLAVVAIGVVVLLLLTERKGGEEVISSAPTVGSRVAQPGLALEIHAGEGDALARRAIGQRGAVPPFQDPQTDSISTFALSLGTGSYTRVQESIARGALPPPEAVRIEEFVNRFRQGYPTFTRPDFELHVDGSSSPFRLGRRIIRIGVRARGEDGSAGEPIATAATIRVRFDSESVRRYRLLGFDRPPGLAQQEPAVAPGTEVAALYEVELRRVEASARILDIHLDYLPGEAGGGGRGDRPSERRESSVSRTALAQDIATPFELSPTRYRLSVIAGTFAEMLRGGGRIEEGTIHDLLPFAQQIAQELRGDPDVVAFAELVEEASRLPRPDPLSRSGELDRSASGR